MAIVDCDKAQDCDKISNKTDMLKPSRRNWHWDKSVNLSHLLYALVIICGLLSWLSKIESNLSVHTSQISEIKETIKNDREATDKHLDRLEDKIDKMLNYQMKSSK